MLRNIHECVRVIDIHSGVIMSLRLNADDQVSRLTSSIAITDRKNNKIIIPSREIPNFLTVLQYFIGYGSNPRNEIMFNFQHVWRENSKFSSIRISSRGQFVILGGWCKSTPQLEDIGETIESWLPLIQEWTATGLTNVELLGFKDRRFLKDPITDNFIKVLNRRGHINSPLPTITVRYNREWKKELIISNRTQFSMTLHGEKNQELIKEIIDLVKRKPDIGKRVGVIREYADKYVFVASLITNPNKEEKDGYQLTIMSELGYDPQVVRLNFKTDEEKNEIISGLSIALTII